MSDDKAKWGNVIRMVGIGIISVGVFGAGGGIHGWRRGKMICDISEATTQIHRHEQSLLRRYTFSPALKIQTRVALLNLLAGPAVMLGRHALHNTILREKDDITLGMSIFIDFLSIPVGCSALSYSLMFLMGISYRLKLGMSLAAFKRIF